MHLLLSVLRTSKELLTCINNKQFTLFDFHNALLTTPINCCCVQLELELTVIIVSYARVHRSSSELFFCLQFVEVITSVCPKPLNVICITLPPVMDNIPLCVTPCKEDERWFLL